MSTTVYRVDYEDRFIKCNKLDELEQGEHYEVLIGCPDDGEPIRILMERQDFRAFKNFFRVCLARSSAGESAELIPPRPVVRDHPRQPMNGNAR